MWTSQLHRAVSTAVSINATEIKRFSSLNEINAGNFDGLSYEDIEELYPEEYEKRLQDKLGYRYPGGNEFYFCQESSSINFENLIFRVNIIFNAITLFYFTGESYIDCCHRIAPFLEEFEVECREAEASSGILVVAHQAILRCIFGYLLKSKLEEIPYIKIPQHTVIQVTWSPKYDVSGKQKTSEMGISGSSQNPTLQCIEEVCSIEYVRMPIEHAEQGVVRLPE